MKRLVLAVALVAMAAPAYADEIIPISGTATFQDQWNFSLSGPGLSIQGGTLLDSSIFTVCAQGTNCDLSGVMENGSASCNHINCGASFNGISSFGVDGTLNLVGSIPLAVTPATGAFNATAPAIMFGQLFILNCPNPDGCDYSSGNRLFTVDVTGTGTVTGYGGMNGFGGPSTDDFNIVDYSFTGTASVVTPEPAPWMLGLTGAGFLLFVWVVRRRRLLRKDSFPSNAF